jgi:hypothetical protein
MRSLLTLGPILAVITIPAFAGPKSPPLPGIVGGNELRQLIRGATIGEAEFAYDSMNEIFSRDGSYQRTDGAREGDVGTYYFSANRFCVKVTYRKLDRCRSVFIDRDKRTWLIDEREEARPVQVFIGHQ